MEKQELLFLASLRYLPNRHKVKGTIINLCDKYSLKLDPDYYSERWDKLYSSKARCKFTNSVKTSVIIRDRNQCQYCNAKRYIEVHHVLPYSVGKTNSIWNLVCACRKCNKEISSNIVLPLNWWLLHPESRNGPNC
ncbi:MAG: HNH endonuclease [bacterium]